MAADDSELDATIVIVTHNRKEDLRRAVASAVAQEGRIEVLVLDDASSDGTDDLMQREFPHARYERVENKVGYIVHRNRAAHLARGRVLVSIDDDAAFSTPQVVAQTLADFDDPRIGAIAIPNVDVLKNSDVRHLSPHPTERWATPLFRGTAYAVQKNVFIKIGGFREEFRHQGEENDFCLRMLGQGYGVRLGRADPIHHYESPKRVRSYIFEQACRNWMINVLLNYPWRYVLPQLAAKSMNALRTGLRRGLVFTAIKGLFRGLFYGMTHFAARCPVRRDRYLAFQRMWRGRRPLLLDEILPPCNRHAKSYQH